MTSGKIIARLLQIAQVLFRHAPSLLRDGPAAGPQKARAILQDLGGTFIKFGQMLSAQPDVLPPAYCSALFDLMDRVPPFSFDEAEKLFHAELGCGSSDLFESIANDPIATASVGQVYEARLDGRKVAVKVQRPEAARDFGCDLRLMEWMVCLVRVAHLKKLYWIIEPTAEFIEWTKEELDFRVEARYAERLGRCARDNPHARVPAVHWKSTTRRVLVVDFLEGITVLNYLRALESEDRDTLNQVAALGFDPQRFAVNVTRTFLQDAFRHGIFHADLHPANLLILPGNVVGYVDFGITGVLSAYSRRCLISLTLAYARGDMDALASSFFRITASRPDSNPRGFRHGLILLAKDWYGRPGDVPRLRMSITRMMFGLLVLSRKTALLPEREAVKYIRSAISVDSQVQRFAPGFDMGHHLELICKAQLGVESRNEVQTNLWNGALRVSEFLRRIESGDIFARLDALTIRAARERTKRRQTLGLSVILFSVSMLVALGETSFQFGLNLLTAELVFLCATAGLLLRALRA